MKKGLIATISALVGISIGAILVGKICSKKIEEQQRLADKHLTIMLLYNQWMITKKEDKSIVSYLRHKGIKKVAIYGMSYVGERLFDELKDSEIKIEYVIDQNADSIYANVPVKHPDDVLVDVDAIIVTAVYFYNDIKEKLCKKCKCEIMSLEDILYEM